MISQLVLRGDPADNESLASFVSRLSAANGLGQCRPLLDRCGLLLGDFDRTNANLATLAHLTGSSVSQLEARSFRPGPDHPRFCSFSGSPIPRMLLMNTSRRVCRACVAEKGYAPALWHLKTYCACHVHERMLVDRCHRCARPYAWDRSSVDVCLCGAEFGEGARAPSSILDICGKIAGARDNDTLGPIGRHDPGALSTFLWYFGRPQPAHTSDLRIYVPSSDLEWWADTVEAGGRILDGWPDSFDEFVKAQCCRDPYNMAMTNEIVATMKSLRRYFSHIFPSIIAQFKTTMVANWPGAIFRQGQFWKEATQSKYITVQTANRLLKTSFNKLLELKNAGHIEIVSRQTTHARVYRAVNSSDVEKLIAANSSVLTGSEAAATLGISPTYLHQLRRAGILQPIRIVSKECKYDPSALQAFSSSLSSHSVRDTNSYRCITPGMASMVDIIKLILNGELKAVWGPSPDKVLSNLFISATDARRLKANRREIRSDPDPDHVSGAVAAATLCLKIPAIKELVRRGFLLVDSTSRVRSNLNIVRGSFEEFDNLFISSSRIGKAHCLKTASVTRRIKAQGVAPAFQGTPALKFPSIWRRDELGLVDLSVAEHPPASAFYPRLTPDRRAIAFASKELCIDGESLAALRRAGFFGAHQPGQRGIHYEQLEAFREQYVSSSELGRKFEMNSSTVTRQLRRLGLSAIYQPQRHERVQACWRRKEVEALSSTQLLSAFAKLAKL